MTHDGADIPALERDFPVSYAIFAMARTHRAVAAAELKRLGLFPNQELMLVQLSAGDGIPQKALAGSLRISHVTVAKMIGRMERAGLVRRTTSAVDRRLSLVFLTEEGRALVGQVLEVWAELERITAGPLDPATRAEFVRAALLVRDSLDASAGDSTQPA